MQKPEIETATVLDTGNALATVITNKSSSCKECGKAAAGICGKKGAGLILKVSNRIGARKGDVIGLGIETKVYIKSYFLIFIMPVIALIVNACTGALLNNYLNVTGVDVIAGLAGLIIAIIYALIKIRKLDKTERFEIVRIYSVPPNYILNSSPEEIDYLTAFNRYSGGQTGN